MRQMWFVEKLAFRASFSPRSGRNGRVNTSFDFRYFWSSGGQPNHVENFLFKRRSKAGLAEIMGLLI